MRRPLTALVLLVALATVAGCGTAADDDPAGDGPRVVATTTIVADLAREVAGDDARVSGILRPNSDPHDYEPRPSDARAVAEADLVLRSGGEVDAWLGDVVRGAGGDAEQVTLADGVGRRGDDPHWWQDPRNGMRALARIRDALTEADPGRRAAYARNARAATARLVALDVAIERCMAQVPREDRKLVTNHDAFGPYAGRYGVDVVGAVIPSRSTQAQASAGEVADLVRTIEREDVRTVFPENSVSARLERAVARESGAEVGPPLITDALSPEGERGDSYRDALRLNTERLVRGFTGGRRTCDLP